MIVLRLLYVGGFDAVFVDDVKQLISTPDFKHILYDAIVGLFYFFDYIPNIMIFLALSSFNFSINSIRFST
jgi:hypothetical protein